MRTFITKCVVGDLVTEGEGNGKKVSFTLNVVDHCAVDADHHQLCAGEQKESGRADVGPAPAGGGDGGEHPVLLFYPFVSPF